MYAIGWTFSQRFLAVNCNNNGRTQNGKRKQLAPTRDEEEWSTTMTKKKKKKAKSRGTYKKKKKSGLLATAAESVPDSRGCVIHQLAGFTHGPRVMQCSARLVPVLSSTVANYPPAASFPEVSSAAAANATPLATYP